MTNLPVRTTSDLIPPTWHSQSLTKHGTTVHAPQCGCSFQWQALQLRLVRQLPHLARSNPRTQRGASTPGASRGWRLCDLCFRASSKAHLQRPLQTASAVQRALPLEQQPGLRSKKWHFQRIEEAAPHYRCSLLSGRVSMYVGRRSIFPSASYLCDLLHILLSFFLSEGQSSRQSQRLALARLDFISSRLEMEKEFPAASPPNLLPSGAWGPVSLLLSSVEDARINS